MFLIFSGLSKQNLIMVFCAISSQEQPRKNFLAKNLSRVLYRSLFVCHISDVFIHVRSWSISDCFVCQLYRDYSDSTFFGHYSQTQLYFSHSNSFPTLFYSNYNFPDMNLFFLFYIFLNAYIICISFNSYLIHIFFYCCYYLYCCWNLESVFFLFSNGFLETT